MKLFASIAVLSAFSAAFAGNIPYPAYVTSKSLFAGVDARGKRAPALRVGKWLTAMPNTKGKTVILDFWATWCGPCRALIPEVNRWQKKFAKDVVIVGITDEDPALIRLFMKEFKMDYAVAVDQKHQMSGAFQVRGFPHVVVISPDGIVRWQGYPGTRNDMLTEKVIAQIVAASKG